MHLTIFITGKCLMLLPILTLRSLRSYHICVSWEEVVVSIVFWGFLEANYRVI